MDASRLLSPLLLAALGAAVLAPVAAAHSPAFSEDDKVRASIGLLNEPVSTYMSTGLDICFTQNTTASPRPALTVSDLAALSATLVAPDGTRFSRDLSGQFGRAGCVTFNQPLVLTLPGQYTVELTGAINGTTFDAKGINAGGAVRDRNDITFPGTGIESDEDLQARIAALEEQVEALEAQGDKTNGAPVPAAAWLMVGLAALAAVRRLRA